MRRVSRKLPGPLIVVVVAIIASYVLGWAAKGVAVVGAVPAGLPKITVPAITVQMSLRCCLPPWRSRS